MEESEINHEIVAAADINTTANQIYLHNFPNTKLITKCIESVTVKDLDKLSADMIVMSPPCQPFCRVGKQRDVADERSKSFLYLLSVLPKLKKIPSYMLVENVKGFDTSESRYRLLTTLTELGYHVQEFLLSPLQFGIPNSRLRYYLIAKRTPLQFNFTTKPHFRTDIPECVVEYLVHRRKDCEESRCNTSGPKVSREDSLGHQTCHCVTCSQRRRGHSEELWTDMASDSSVIEATSTSKIHPGTADHSADEQLQVVDENKLDSHSDLNVTNHTTANQSQARLKDGEIMDQCELSLDKKAEAPLYEQFRHVCGTVGEYLENQEDEYFEQYLIPEKFFKRFWVMDLVTSESTNSCCFTKRYAHHMEGSGSIIEMNRHGTVDLSYYKTKRVYDDTVHEAVRAGKLRFFTPREIANLMCFPQSFSFPSEMSNIQMYRVLGNSLNVHVVAVLLRLVTYGDGLPSAE